MRRPRVDRFTSEKPTDRVGSAVFKLRVRPRDAPIARQLPTGSATIFGSEVVQLVAKGDHRGRALTRSAPQSGEWRGHAASGRRFENVDEVYIFSFEDGQIAEAWGIEETLERLRQLGALLIVRCERTLGANGGENCERKSGQLMGNPAGVRERLVGA